MAQEFVIKSPTLEDKINQLLPSQGGAQAGVDLSASTMVVPIVDLTESAEGSGLRQDLQTCISHNTATAFSVSGTTTTIINTTGYFRVFAAITQATSGVNSIDLTDGTTSKKIYGFAGGTGNNLVTLDFIVKLEAGDSLSITSSNAIFEGSTRQIADLSGNLINP